MRRPVATGGFDTLPGIEPVGAGDWIRMGLYTFPGWGKTSFIGTASEGGLRTLIIRSSLDLMPSRILRLPGIDQFVSDTWEKQLEIQEFLRMSNHGYDWVWWDCASVAQDVLLDDIWAGTVAAKPARAFLIGEDGKVGKPNTTPTSGLDQGEYGRNMERIGQWVRHMVGANSFHFGITFHPFEGPHPTNDQGGTLLTPWVQGKGMVQKISGYMNMVTFMEVMSAEKDGEELKWRRFHVAENDRFYAKDQYDAFLPRGFADNLTIPKLMAACERARGKPLGRG